jgi:hypothetical protein
MERSGVMGQGNRKILYKKYNESRCMLLIKLNENVFYYLIHFRLACLI